MAEPQTEQAASAPLIAENIRVGYGNRVIIDDLSVTIPAGELTVIVGPNACGKSTLLRALARMLPVTAGRVVLNGTPIKQLASKAIARQLGLLPQSPNAPDGIIVADLVARGRYPHQGVLKQWSDADAAAVKQAMQRARVDELADRPVAELSGGQRQRVWIAMTLAQDTPILLLDEPTTYLDISHQVEVLRLARQLQREGRTVVVVLHELNLAFRYATNLIVMRDGAIVAEGAVNDVVTAELVHEVYGLLCVVLTDPISGRPLVSPTEEAEL